MYIAMYVIFVYNLSTGCRGWDIYFIWWRKMDDCWKEGKDDYMSGYTYLEIFMFSFC